MSHQITAQHATDLDAADRLRAFREEFYLQDGVVYLDGNSLGLFSKRAEQSTLEILDSWKRHGIDGWSRGEHPWFDLSEKLGAQMASLIGAQADEVVVTGSTTVNLHQLVATFYQPQLPTAQNPLRQTATQAQPQAQSQQRTKIIADELDFPTDIYALQSQLKLHGFDPATHLIRVHSADGRTLKEEDLIEAMTDEVALVVLPSVLYRSGQLLDLPRLTAAAHARGIRIGFDLCHSIGALPHQLSEWGVDFAFWCNYKYLNGGPGSVAGLYVNRRHFGQTPGLAGWFASDKSVQFDMAHDFTPAHHAGAYQLGTPHMLSTAPLIGSLDLFAEAGIDRIREKSLRLTRFLIDVASQELVGMGFSFGNPLLDQVRGGHVCLVHEEAVRICKALKQAGVVPDFRQPDVIRLAPIALYTSFADVWEAVQRLKRIMVEKTYEQFEQQRDVIA